MIALFFATAVAGDCPVGDPIDRTVDDLEASFELAEETFVGNPDRFGRVVSGPVKITAGCLAEPITVELAARYHRLYAIHQDPSGKFGLDSGVVAASFRAARALEPAYTFPDDLLPPSHGLRAAWDALPPETPATERVRAPRHGQLWFDGTPGLERPTSAATFLQWTDATQAVVLSAYVPAGAPLPDYPRVPVLRRGLTAGAIGTGVVATGLYTGALIAEARLKGPDPPRDLDRLRALERTNHGLFLGSVSSAAVAVGLGVSALLVGER